MTIDSKKSLLISAGFHGVLILLFLLIQVRPSLNVPEYVEMSFVGAAVSSQPGRTRGKTLPVKKEAAPPAVQRATSTPKQEIVRLPKRRMSEEEEPFLRVKEENKIAVQSETPILPEEKTNPQNEELPPGLPQQTPVTGQKGLPVPANLESNQQKETPPLVPGASEEANHLFKIEGEASRRRVLSKVIPTYPKGYHGEGIIKLRFRILPNGLVTDIVPILKGDAVLERVTIEAFQQWRFDPIPENKPQKTVAGVITFRYVLK
ncbi:MAG: hypothetical protein GXO76_04835 [Calditrichaeota bacterium]|nr:hypothetical protein [Calditrichota bacterium]